MSQEYNSTIRVGDNVYPVSKAEWHIDTDVYLDHGEKPALNPSEWTHTKSVWIHGVELTEYGKYWLDQAICDYIRSSRSYKAQAKAKRRRKIKRKQIRARMRRRRKGLA